MHSTFGHQADRDAILSKIEVQWAVLVDDFAGIIHTMTPFQLIILDKTFRPIKKDTGKWTWRNK